MIMKGLAPFPRVIVFAILEQGTGVGPAAGRMVLDNRSYRGFPGCEVRG
jgi:hypothetical protein